MKKMSPFSTAQYECSKSILANPLNQRKVGARIMADAQKYINWYEATAKKLAK